MWSIYSGQLWSRPLVFPVAERQKNGTIHFHLLTNDFMAIKIVNGFSPEISKNDF